MIIPYGGDSVSAESPPPTKRCNRCGKELPATDEFFHRKGKYLNSKCKLCVSAVVREWQLAHPERQAETRRRWKERHPDKVKAENERNAETYRARARRWHEENRDRHLAYMRENWQRNLEENRAKRRERMARRDPVAERIRLREKEIRRRAQKLSTENGKVDYVAILDRDGPWCYLCCKPIMTGEALDYDHVIPLARGGPHVAENIRPTHRRCNQVKANRLPSELTLPLRGSR